MDFCMRLASEVIIEEINGSPNKNFVMSPLSLNCLFNMLASGAKGRTLEQLLKFLESESIDDINAKSSRMIRLATMEGDPNKEEEPFLPHESQLFGKSSTRLQSTLTSGSSSGGQFWQNWIGHNPFYNSGNGEYSLPKGPELSFICGIWTDQKFPINPSFQQIAKNVYKAKAKTMDFAFQVEQVRKEVNMWAENETKGLIKDLIPTGFINEGTMLILGNALYFKGEWSSPFETSRTQQEAFYLLNGTTIEVPFMKTKNEYYDFASFEGFKILKLPYASGKDKKRFSMYIFLPHQNYGLQELKQNFNSQSLILQKNLPLQHMELSKVWIPKFKFSYGFDASEIMKKLGLTLPFQPVGDFTEMVDCPLSNLLYVSNVLHKSFIEVNEEGTEAAAVSWAYKRVGCAGLRYPPPQLPSFVADHPSMFMIKEDVSGTVFFTGTVLNPLKED